MRLKKKRKRIWKLHSPRVPDKNPSPASHTISQHYASLGLKKLWNQDRVKRLRDFMRVDNHFLAALINMPHGRFEQHLRERNVISGPSALLVCMVEDFLMKVFVNDTVSVFDFDWKNDG